MVIRFVTMRDLLLSELSQQLPVSVVYRIGWRLLLLENAACVVQEPGHGIEQQGRRMFVICNAKYIETSVVKLSPNPTKILPERKQKQQSYSSARSARAIPCMRYSTQGTATLFPRAL